MDDVQTLLSEFIAADRAGGAPDPLAYLDRVPAAARGELAALIDAYLARAPRRPFDPSAFAASPAAGAAVRDLSRALGGRSGLWPALLPRLRHRARLRRAELVERLAAELGAVAQRDKVGDYYHAMERGGLPADGVSDRVLEALGRIVGESVDALREAGRGLRAAAGGVGSPSTAAPAYARVAEPDAEFAEEGEEEGGDGARTAPPPPGERDFVDELFTGASGGGT